VEKDSLIAGIKLLSYRLVMAQPLKENADKKLYNFVKENYPEEWKLTEEIDNYVKTGYKRDFTEEEKLYFTIQIKRIKDLFE